MKPRSAVSSYPTGRTIVAKLAPESRALACREQNKVLWRGRFLFLGRLVTQGNIVIKSVEEKRLVSPETTGGPWRLDGMTLDDTKGYLAVALAKHRVSMARRDNLPAGRRSSGEIPKPDGGGQRNRRNKLGVALASSTG